MQEAAHDSYVSYQDPNTNYGADNSLVVGVFSYPCLVYVDFDTEAIPANATVENATLNLYRSSSDETPFEFYTAWVMGDWSESTITWNNSPTQRYLLSFKNF